MIKVYLAIGIIIAIATSSFTIGYKLATGNVAKKEVKVITANIEDYNEDAKIIKTHAKYVAKLQKQHEEELANIPLVYIHSDCSTSDFERLWNETISTSNKLSVEN